MTLGMMAVVMQVEGEVDVIALIELTGHKRPKLDEASNVYIIVVCHVTVTMP